MLPSRSSPRWLFAACLIAAAAPVGGARGQESLDSELKAIGPLVSESLAAVVRIDVAALDIEGLFREVLDPIGGFPPPEVKPLVIQATREFLAAGGTTAFVIANVDEIVLLPPQGPRPPLWVVPLGPRADVARLTAVFARVGAAERMGDLLLVGDAELLARAKQRRAAARPELAAALGAAEKRAVRIAILPNDNERKVLEQMLPNLPAEVGGLPTAPLARGVSWIGVGLQVGRATDVRIVIESPDVAAAGKLREALAQLWPHVARHFDASAQQVVSRFKVESQGTRLVLSPQAPTSTRELLEKELKPLVQAATENHVRHQSMNHLKQLALAIHNYHDRHRSLPPTALVDRDGRPLLSWRVLLLPYLDNELYKKFRLDEPWDSAHNRALIPAMPEVYRWPSWSPDPDYKTVYLAPVGPGTVFSGGKGVAFSAIKDGTSHTIMLVEADDAHAVVWTKPDDWAWDPNQPRAGLGGHFQGLFQAALCDGSVRAFQDSIDLSTLRALFTAAGGEAFDWP